MCAAQHYVLVQATSIMSYMEHSRSPNGLSAMHRIRLLIANENLQRVVSSQCAISQMQSPHGTCIDVGLPGAEHEWLLLLLISDLDDKQRCGL